MKKGEERHMVLQQLDDNATYRAKLTAIQFNVPAELILNQQATAAGARKLLPTPENARAQGGYPN